MRKLPAIALLTLLCLPLHAGKDLRYPVSDIPDSLKAGASSVVRLRCVETEVISPAEALVKVTKAVTVLSEKGGGAARFVCTQSAFSTLISFEGAIYASDGSLIRKIRKSDLSSSGLTGDSTLADDMVRFWYSPQLASYPVTVEYSYTTREKGLVNSYGSFYGIGAFEQSVQQASASVAFPTSVSVLSWGSFPGCTIEESVRKDGKTVRIWKTGAIAAIKTETYMPALEDISPEVEIFPETFIYAGAEVSNRSWESYGGWIYSLSAGRDILPDELRAKVHEIADGLCGEMAKAEALYSYMCSSCRYVSIQLGIGGLQPRSVAQTYAAKFGDCKALTLYLKAMLAEVGIPSDICLVSTGRKRLSPSLAAPGGIDHVILKVNFQDGPLFVECTSSTLPMGYVHSNIDGHDIIVLSAEGSHLETVPASSEKENVDLVREDIVIRDDGNAEVVCDWLFAGRNFEGLYGLVNVSADKRKDSFGSLSNIPSARVQAVDVELPGDFSVRLRGSITAPAFASVAQGRLTIPLQTFHGRLSRMRAQRTLDICIPRGYTKVDSLVYHVPEGYAIELLPVLGKVTSRFGEMEGSCSWNPEERTLEVRLSLVMWGGSYAPESVAEFIEFRDAVSRMRTGKIVLKKAE